MSKNKEEIKKLLETQCSPFKNPVGAMALNIANKVKSTRDLMSSWENDQTEISFTQNTPEGVQESKIKVKDLLSKAGFSRNSLFKIQDFLSGSIKLNDLLKNYAKESNNDFLTKMSTFNTYMQNKGFPVGSNCDVLSSIFSISMGLGKNLLGLLNTDLSTLNSSLQRVNSLIQQGIKNSKVLVESLQRMQAIYENMKNLIDSLPQKLKDLENQIRGAIESELNALAEMGLYNSRMALANLLSDYANDPCVSGVLNSISVNEIKRLI